MLSRFLLAFGVLFSSVPYADEYSIICPEGTRPNGETTPEVSEAWCELSHDGAIVLNGPYRAWWPNGALGNMGQYDLGEPVGKWTSWYSDGQLESEQWYENGTLIRERRWDKNGDET